MSGPKNTGFLNDPLEGRRRRSGVEFIHQSGKCPNGAFGVALTSRDCRHAMTHFHPNRFEKRETFRSRRENCVVTLNCCRKPIQLLSQIQKTHHCVVVVNTGCHMHHQKARKLIYGDEAISRLSTGSLRISANGSPIIQSHRFIWFHLHHQTVFLGAGDRCSV